MDYHENPSKWGVITVTSLITLVVVLIVAYGFGLGFNQRVVSPTIDPSAINSTLPDYELPEREVGEVSKDEEDKKMKEINQQGSSEKILFTDDSASYTLYYLKNITLNSLDENVLRLNPLSQSIGLMNEAFAQTARQNKEKLSQGLLGSATWAVKGSHKLVRLNNGQYAQRYISFYAFDVCSVQFRAVLEFYDNFEQRVMISLEGPSSLKSYLSDYFTTGSCGTASHWIHDNLPGLYQRLEAGSAPNEVQNWYDSFNEIVDSVKVSY